MQIHNSRREFLTGSLALSAVTITPAEVSNPLATPSGPMALARRLERELRDGAKIIVSREWRVEFSRHADGIVVVGNQLTAMVDAPGKLQGLARIEEQRPTDGMFPVLITENGLISRAGEIEDSASVEDAVRMANEMIARLDRSESEQAQMRQAITRLQNASSGFLEALPGDLFFPNNAHFEDSRQMLLPDGSIGEFTVAYRARHASQGPWLDLAERHILTRAGSDIRRSKEVWTMRPA